ncbi:MAG: hypothetical protein H6Q58_796 [Firmicutes bacterium]|nr:hypothetical protein [Bacillota bacterium]
MKKEFMMLLVMMIFLVLFGCSNQGIEVKNSDELNQKAVVSVVEGFGQKLKQVSLLASSADLEKSMNEIYGDIVTPELLEKFLSDPVNAPGRLASSPWPDRIEIASVEKTSEGVYKVEGTIIEITSTEQGSGEAAAKRPVTLEVKKAVGKWLISSVLMGDYQTGVKILYRNSDYGFAFLLPKSWSGYTIITENWQGQSLEGSTNGQITETGPKLLIRHPQWVPANPRQDIPIMVFTIAQWDLVQQEKMSVGAAPMPPSELGRNSTCVFALPARYNYAFPAGFEEVEQILEENPLKPFDLQ